MSKRLPKTTPLQFEELLKFVESNKTALFCKSGYIVASASAKEHLWHKFAADINAKGLGPPKTSRQWRKVFNEWKVNTKRKIKSNSQATQLTDLQERLLNLMNESAYSDEMMEEQLLEDVELNEAVCNQNLPQETMPSLTTNHTVAEHRKIESDNLNIEQMPEFTTIKQEENDDSFDRLELEEDKLAPDGTSELHTDHIYTTKSSTPRTSSQQHNKTLKSGVSTAEALNNLAAAIDNLANAKKKESEALLLLAKAKLLNAKTNYCKTFNRRFEDIY